MVENAQVLCNGINVSANSCCRKVGHVRYSTRSFGLVPARGQEVRCVRFECDSASLPEYLGSEITVLGRAAYHITFKPWNDGDTVSCLKPLPLLILCPDEVARHHGAVAIQVFITL